MIVNSESHGRKGPCWIKRVKGPLRAMLPIVYIPHHRNESRDIQYGQYGGLFMNSTRLNFELINDGDDYKGATCTYTRQVRDNQENQKSTFSSSPDILKGTRMS